MYCNSHDTSRAIWRRFICFIFIVFSSINFDVFLFSGINIFTSVKDAYINVNCDFTWPNRRVSRFRSTGTCIFYIGPSISFISSNEEIDHCYSRYATCCRYWFTLSIKLSTWFVVMSTIKWFRITLFEAWNVFERKYFSSYMLSRKWYSRSQR